MRHTDISRAGFCSAGEIFGLVVTDEVSQCLFIEDFDP